MSAIELEHAAQQLPPDQLEEFAHWFEESTADQCDRQTENDINTGKLDVHAAKADSEFQAGRCTPL